ncbi:hypothetical protein FB451DRAFT_1525745 [Mycena latifolia]|nr:hypothetical protein FB451DRAFT_1525745 [Mycena latifolia]
MPDPPGHENNIDMVNDRKNVPVHYPQYPSIYNPSPGPPIALSQIPAPMPAYFHPYPYFNPPQIFSPGFLPPTNGAESAHNLLYNAAGRSHDIWEGTRRLYRVSRETEMLYEAVTAGHVQARFQGLRPQPASRITPTWYENDGRAPDTRERLAAVAKLEADLAAQKSTLTETERFIAANTSSKSPAASGTAAPGSHTSLDPRLLQSYKWDANSCFIDAPMEAIFRAFVTMSDAVRGELLRRIRTECPSKSGLRDIFEHFWLRGLLSGAISASDPSAKKESSKSLHSKLVTALDAGQRNVKRLIQTRWDGGEFVAGMPGCARTWTTQMVQMDTTQRLRQYFGVHYRLKYVCGSNHVTENIHPQVYYEFPIYRDDLALAQGFIPPGIDQPSLEDLLVHSIPRDRYGPRPGRSAAFIHQVETSLACPHASCSDGHASLLSISTDWPLILRVSPNFARVEGADETFRDVSCPLIMKVGPDVEYELISRVIYSGSMAAGAVGHYTTQLRIGNSTYMYNDLLRDGALAYLGPLHLLEEFHPQTTFVIYLRRSREERTTRTVNDLEADRAKIPAKAAPFPVGDSDNEAENQVGRPAASDPISQMILDALEGPETPQRPPDFNSDHSPAKRDNDPYQVQCEKCRFWSHMRCLPEDIDWGDPEVTFICFRCEPRPVDALFKLGEIVMLPYPGASDWRDDDVLWYPARFSGRMERSAGTVREFKFKWLECVDWSDHEDPETLFPLLIPRTYQREREFCQDVANTVLKSRQIGKIHLPSYLQPEQSAPLDHPLIAIFRGAVSRLAVVIAAFHIEHPVVKCYTDYFSTRPSTARDTEASLWLTNLRLSPTPELEALIQPPMHVLLSHSRLGVPPLEWKRRVLVVGPVLLQLLAIQHELGEELNLNGDTLRELFDRAIVRCSNDGTTALQAMFLATERIELKDRKGWDTDRFSRHMLRFNTAHTVYDPSLRPPTWRRVKPSSIIPNHPVLFAIPTGAALLAPANEIPKTVDPPPLRTGKRKGAANTVDEPRLKRIKRVPSDDLEIPKTEKEEEGKSKKRAKPKPTFQGPRRSTRLVKPVSSRV